MGILRGPAGLVAAIGMTAASMPPACAAAIVTRYLARLVPLTGAGRPKSGI